MKNLSVQLKSWLIVIMVLCLLAACTGKKAIPTLTPLSLPPTNASSPPIDTVPAPTNTPWPTYTPLPTPSYPTWTPQPTPTPLTYPEARALSKIVYSPKADQALMYGGMLSTAMGADIYEVWRFDTQDMKWSMAKPMPSLCGTPPGVYDSQADRVILHCGRMNGAVWEYNFETDAWSDRNAANTPKGFDSARMAYDADSQKSILIGGMIWETMQMVHGTWAYDYATNTWTEMKPKTEPPGLFAHAMAYDSESDRIILWGGYIFAGVDSQDNWLADPPENLVWAYDYNTDTWESFPIMNGPDLPRYKQLAQSVQAEYIPSIDRTLFYWDDQLWAYDYNHNTWEKAKGDVLSGAGSRMMHVMVYLSSIDRLLVFGGATMGVDWYDLTFNDKTWLYDPQIGDWTQVGP